MINRERLINTFVELASLDCPSFNERMGADYVIARLKSLGLSPDEDGAGAEIGGTAGNIFAVLDGRAENPPRLFTAHLDTVPPCKNKKIIVGEKITSDGTTILGADDFAAVACILEAIAVIKENNLPCGPLEFLFTPAEEVYSKGINKFDLNKIKAKMAFTPDYDGPLGTCINRAPTIISFCAKIIGRAAHAGFAPEKGISAITAAAHAVGGLKLGRIDQETTANVGLIEGGSATNIVPEVCVVRGEVRSYNHQKAQKQIEIIREAFKKEGCCEFQSEICIKAYEVSENSETGRFFKGACETAGLVPSFDASFGGSDNNTLAEHGIEGVVIASAMHCCHTTEEYTCQRELTGLAELLVELMTAH